MKTALRLSTVVGSLLLASSVQAQPAPANPPPKPEAPKPAEPKPVAPKPAPAPAPATDVAPAAPAEAVPPGEAEAPEEEEAEPEPALPPGPTPPPSGTAGVGSLPVFPEPAADASQLKKQGEERPGANAEQHADIYAEDWWTHARPVLELHGYFRARGELFHKFSLGRVDLPQDAIWPRPADDSYVAFFNGTQQSINGFPGHCTPSEADKGDSNDAEDADQLCKNQTQAGANMRFRLNPELHISDNLRVMSQIDLLDNVVFGSTPGGYSVTPSAGGGYAVAARDGYTPLAFFDDTAAPPSAGRNGVKDSIVVKRVWAEYSTPVGEVRFGRMPNHWGLGMYLNSGDGYDDNYSSTVDRAQIVTGIKPLELYFSAAMDFPNEGAISDSVSLPNPQPYDLAQLDDVDQYTFSIARKKNPQLERLALTRGDIVLNGGLMLIYRSQQLADDREVPSGSCSDGAASIGCAPGDLKFTRRGAHAWIPDLWLQLKYKRFRFEAEAITVQGSIENYSKNGDDNLAGDPGYDMHQWGLATEIEQKLAEDRLRLGFNFGWASGDADVDSLTPGEQLGDRDITAFAFHPSYSVDLILYRNILTRVESSYYFKPSIDYDFSRDPNGQRIGGGLSVIWSRASSFMQAPGHATDLGIELDARLYYQSKDGALNDVPDQMGGFFAMLEYGALFPMAGLGYPDAEAAAMNAVKAGAADTSVAQTLRLYLGVFF